MDFGYGGVLNWPKEWFKLPFGANVAFHYNNSENFIPATDRVDQYRRPVESPAGISEDWGVTINLWDNKLIARLNWFNATLVRASSNVSGQFNGTNANIFNHYGILNREIRRLDSNNDDIIDDVIGDEFEFDPVTGLTPEGLTREQAIAAEYPNFGRLKAARANIEPHLTDELKTAYNYRMAPDGSSNTQAAGPVTDTNDIESKGFELELIYNPSRNWRIAFNAASQETVLTNIAPDLTALLQNTWLPHLATFGDLDWNAPAEVVSGNTVSQQIIANVLDYYIIKGQEGRPQAEQRKWRMNLVTRYQFSEGRFKGFSVGGAARWEDQYATGFPLYLDENGLNQPDVFNPWLSDRTLSFDLTFGYRRRILRNKDWTAQLNIRNLQNWFSDTVSPARHQPDGSVARARFDPPMQMLLTNTFRF